MLGADVTVYTDHAPLKSLFTAEMKNTRVQRWAILLDEYQVKIKYRQGIHNGRADMLSRIRIKPTKNEIEESNDIVAVDAPNDKTDTGSKRHSLQAVELSQWFQAAVQIVSNLPAPSNGGPIYCLFGMPAMRTRWMAGTAAHKSG